MGKALWEVAHIVKPGTLLGWPRKLVAGKCDGSQRRESVGRKRVAQAVEDLVRRFAREHRTWGCGRIAGSMKNVGHPICAQTVGNILARHGLVPVPERKKKATWTEPIQSHQAVLAATDFITTEIWTVRGLMTYYVLFFVHLDTRKVHIAGIALFPDEGWMKQLART